MSRPPLNRGAGLALWRQISETLEREIRDGVHAAGARLPTEAELAARFGVNRHTVRRAMAELEESGLVDVTQGRGTFVHLGAIAYLIGRRTRFHENMQRENRHADLELLSSATESATGAVARELEVPVGSPVIRLETRSHADGLPLGLTSRVFPGARFPGLIEIFAETRSVTASLARLGVADYTRRRTRVSARLPDAREQRLLEIARTRPVTTTEAINVDADGRVIEYGQSSFASDRIQLVFEG